MGDAASAVPRDPQVHSLFSQFHDELTHRMPEVRARSAHVIEDFAQAGIDIPVQDAQLPLTPAVMPLSAVAALESTCRSILTGVERVVSSRFASSPRRLKEFTRMAGADEELALFETAPPPGDWALVARPDLVIGGQGPMVVETNVIPYTGHFPQADVALRTIMGVPALAGILRSHRCAAFSSVEALASVLLATVPRLTEKTLALVEWGDYLSRYEYVYRHLARGLDDHGIHALVAPVEQLSVGDAVSLAGRRIDVVYRFFDPPDPPSPALLEQYRSLLAAVYRGRVAVIGHFGQKVLAAKSLLALISEQREADGVEESARSAVPWTRVVADRSTTYGARRVDLLPFVESHQDRLVLKGSLRSGGVGTMVGRAVTAREWSSRLGEVLASSEQWIVQEWVDSDPVELAFMVDGELVFRRCHLDYGVFLFGRRFGGAVQRNTTPMAPWLTHAGHGGGAMPVLFVP